MELQSMKVIVREASGKGPARQTRREGTVPGVLYGGGQDPVSLKVDLPALRRLIHDGGAHAVVQLDVEGKPSLSSPALIKAVQYHPVNGKVVHADFFRIRLDTKITTSVPITLVGQARGVVEGGVIDPQLREVEVECLALEVPHEIKVDVSNLGIGDSIHVSDLVAPESVTIITEAERPVVTVHAPRAIKEETPVEGEVAAGAEPEVIGEKKKDEKEDDSKDKKK
ncbi:MAG: 50S ribosomal protein L25 [Candidatus Hydrogenedentes bacterium]|nr:50S ribosomal protein L25 [Candidatus Hydrogenedentota bacterium]